MSRIRMYTKQGCRFSEEARFFLEEKGVPYDEIDITGNAALEREMAEASAGASTTPQIFIDGQHLGGLDDLVEEDHQGHLAVMLANGLDYPGQRLG
jgi:glutaredoxin 3